MMEAVVDTLAERGWLVLPDFLAPEQVAELREQAQAQLAAGEFHAAGVGRAHELNVNESIRGDQVQWLEPAEQGVLAELSGIHGRFAGESEPYSVFGLV